MAELSQSGSQLTCRTCACPCAQVQALLTCLDDPSFNLQVCICSVGAYLYAKFTSKGLAAAAHANLNPCHYLLTYQSPVTCCKSCPQFAPHHQPATSTCANLQPCALWPICCMCHVCAQVVLAARSSATSSHAPASAATCSQTRTAYATSTGDQGRLAHTAAVQQRVAGLQALQCTACTAGSAGAGRHCHLGRLTCAAAPQQQQQ